MRIQTFSCVASVDEMMLVLEDDGVLIIERAVDDGVIDQLMADVDSPLAKRPVAGGEFFGGKCKRLHGLAGLSGATGALLVQPQLKGIADAALLPNCLSYRVQVLGLLQVWPGGKPQPLHRDTGVYQPFVACGPKDKPILISFIWALSDFTADNGATRLVPGSHKWDRERTAERCDITQAVMPKGSVVIYYGSLLHGMGVNHASKPRTGLVSGFCVGWLRQEENQYLTCPPEVAKSLPVEVQQLLGYRSHSPILGWSEDRDPDHLLSEKADHEADGYETVQQEKQLV